MPVFRAPIPGFRELLPTSKRSANQFLQEVWTPNAADLARFSEVSQASSVQYDIPNLIIVRAPKQKSLLRVGLATPPWQRTTCRFFPSLD